MIDGAWQLADVTWGSGYVNFANQFVQRTNDAYFLTPPDEFAKDHFREDAFMDFSTAAAHACRIQKECLPLQKFSEI
jgi:transglutaminase/protease-like cytokinesis protein 3